MQALATKYRPSEFKDVCSQKSIITILNKQIEKKQVKNCYLFCGPSGCGKTTIARIFSYKINEFVDSSNNICSSEPIEIDAASNNSVENVRQIIKAASERSLDGKYKVYIIDEAHALSNTAWQAFLKCIEEPPEYTIFIFCTTDPQKIPATILNRVMRFNFTRISSSDIKNRLDFICNKEGLINYFESTDYISKICNNQMRDAISMLDKCAAYSSDININNVITCLGSFSYDVMFNFVNAFVDRDKTKVINIIESLFHEGKDLNLFFDSLLSFGLDLLKYILFKSFDCISIPQTEKNNIDYCVNFENSDQYIQYIVSTFLELKQLLKNEPLIKDVSEAFILSKIGD